MSHRDTHIPSRGDFDNVFQMLLLYPKPSQSFLILLSNSTSIFSIIPQIFPECLQRFQGTVLDTGNTRVEVGDCSFLLNLRLKNTKQNPWIFNSACQCMENPIISSINKYKREIRFGPSPGRVLWLRAPSKWKHLHFKCPSGSSSLYKCPQLTVQPRINKKWSGVGRTECQNLYFPRMPTPVCLIPK